MRIGALSRASGVSERLLRYYEEQGLLRPARLPNGYREYGEPDVAAVRRIRALLAAGLPTAVISEVLGCVHDDDRGRLVPEACPGMAEHLAREHARLGGTIDRLSSARAALGELMAALPDRSGA